MLFWLAKWHALAKLRMHTEPTLSRMEAVTIILGCELRRFANTTCSVFSTVELPKEAAARSRRCARDQAKAGTSKESTGSSTTPGSQSKQKKKRLNLSTYKAHLLGDYMRTICMFGTTDSYSTQTVSSTVHPQYGIRYSVMIGRV